MISKELNKHRSSISRVLIDLEKEGYARCENPGDDKYRLYSITQKAKRVFEKLKEYN